MLGKCILQRVAALNPCKIYGNPLLRFSSFPFAERSVSSSCVTGGINDVLKKNICAGFINNQVFLNVVQIQVRHYAARKGTRERREKLKKKRKKEKIEVAKVPFLLRRKLEKEAATVYRKQRPVDYSEKGHPVDNVYFYHKYDTHQWSFAEAVQNHREMHHPTMYNIPNCPLLARIHLEFQYPNRPNKFQDGWKSVVEMKLPFLLPGMAAPTVLAFCPNEPDLIEEAIEAGADMAGGSDLIKSIQSGVVNPADYEYVVAHPLMITELTAIRGLIKKKFPNVKTKTLDIDVPSLVKKFKAGMRVSGAKTDLEPDYGWVEAPVGTLDMDIEGMEGNLEAIFLDTLTHRVPTRTPETFVLGCVLKTAHSFEQFKLNAQPYFAKYYENKAKQASKEKPSDDAGESDESLEAEAVPKSKAQASSS